MTIYKAGDVIHKAKPFALLLLEDHKRKNCDYCLKKLSDPKRCAGCRTMYYCSKKCAKGDWKIGHKFKECQVMKENDLAAMVRPYPGGVRTNFEMINFMTTMKFVIRLVLKKKLDPSYSRKHKMADGTQLGFEELDGFKGLKYKKSQPTWKEMPKIVAKALANVGVEVTHPEIWHLYSIYAQNAIALTPYVFGQDNIIGTAIYVLKRYPHSCCNNSAIVFDQNKLHFRAIRGFNTELEPPTLCRVDVTDERSQRQEALAKFYNIACKCVRCEKKIEFPKENVIFAGIENQSHDKALLLLIQYIRDTKKVHRGGRTIKLLRNTKIAYTMLRARGLAASHLFLADMKETARVLFGPEGWLKVKQELDVDEILIQIEMMNLVK